MRTHTHTHAYVCACVCVFVLCKSEFMCIPTFSQINLFQVYYKISGFKNVRLCSMCQNGQYGCEEKYLIEDMPDTGIKATFTDS